MRKCYIHESDIYKLFDKTGMAKLHCAQIDELPRADVVPRRLYEEQLKSPLPFPTESEIATSVLDEVEELLNECRMHLIVGYDKVSVDHKLAALRAKYANADYRPHKELIKERNDLEYKLIGVMHFVDKWLDDDELKQPEVNRAATMREKTLQIVEGQRSEIERLQRAVSNSLPSGVQACSEEEAMKIGYERGRAAATSEIFAEIDEVIRSHYHSYKPKIANKSLIVIFNHGARTSIVTLKRDIDELRKKYTNGGKL